MGNLALVPQFLLAVDRMNIYSPIIISAAFPYAVILLGMNCL